MCEVAQLCPTLCNPMDCSLPGSFVYGIFQARIRMWVAISFSRWSFQLRDWTRVSCIADGFFYGWATRGILLYLISIILSLFFSSAYAYLRLFLLPTVPNTQEIVGALETFDDHSNSDSKKASTY